MGGDLRNRCPTGVYKDATPTGTTSATTVRFDDDDTDAEQESRSQLTSGQWSRLRTKWFVDTVDVVRGYTTRFSLVELTLRGILCSLALYGFLLMRVAGAQRDAYMAFFFGFLSAILDCIYGVQGSAAAMVIMGLIVWLLTVVWMRRPSDVLLIDFKTYRHATCGGDPRNTAGVPITYERFMAESRAAKHLDGSACFNDKSLDFQEKILNTSCIGDGISIFPNSILKETAGEEGAEAERKPLTMRGAREEAEDMMSNVVEQLLEATNTEPQEIGILIVNCSLFCPTPSLSAMIVNKFGMRSDIASYNLGGMGCSASPISIDLAKRLLTSPHQRNTIALVVSTENITQNWYRGNDRGMLVSNTLFRCGAAAILLSNRSEDAPRARFQLLHTVRNHTGQSDDCYGAVIQEEDAEGVKGVRLSKQIMQVAGDALKVNISTLGPLVLPLSEQLRFLANMVARKAVRGALPVPGSLRRLVQSVACAVVPLPGVRGLVGFKPVDAGTITAETPSVRPLTQATKTPRGVTLTAALKRQLPPYVPNFTKAFEWICVHTGGRAVIDAMENNLELPAYYLEPSRLSLYRFGNVSSASIWYELEIVSELGNTCGASRPGGVMPPAGQERRLRRGDCIWQIAFGSGFKCNSAVWKALRDH